VSESGSPDAGAEDGRWPLVERYFAAALETPPEARDALLAEECADEVVRADVRRLLARHEALVHTDDGAESFLTALDVGRAVRLLDNEAAGHPRTIGRYEVIRPLGRGATGVVYLANDPALGRAVAVKLLSPALSADRAATRRFEQEARAASALDHPRVVTLHEIGCTSDDRLFIAMAYHEGTTLRERIACGPLPIADAVRIAAEIGEGLAAAHAKGIVHRDIKPENVLLTERGASIVDFGIAKMAGQLLTRTGAALGTAAYMSPEQTHGSDVDGRTDVWSLGVVLHEMLTGTRPFRSEGGEALVYAIRHDEPARMERSRPEVPAAIADVVHRCLRKNPMDRYASADALVLALRSSRDTDGVDARRRRLGLRLGVLALLATGAAAALVPRLRDPARREPARAVGPVPLPSRVRSIAVVPFTSEGAVGQEAYLTQGMTSEVMLRLASVPELRVADPVSVVQASKKTADIRTLAARLGTSSVLRGTVRHAGDRMRVSAQLVQAADGRELWARVYDRPASEAYSIADAIRREVMAALGVNAPDASAGSALHARTDPVAYDLYLRGRFAYDQRTPTGLAEAGVYFRESIAHDSTFARAYIGLADVLSAAQDSRADERFRRAKPLVDQALARDSTLAEAHRAAGWIAMWYDRDWNAAERHLRRALALDPSDIWAYHSLAAYLSAVGRPSESLAITRQATAIDPVSSATATHVGLHLFWSRRYDESIAVLEHALTVDTTWKRTHAVLGRAYLAVGRYDDAIRALRRTGYEYAAFSPEAILAYGLGVAGHTAEARGMVDRLEERARGAYVRPVDLVAAHLGLGDTTRALEWAERMPDDRGSMFFVLTEPLFDPIRATPRFQRVIERLGLAEAARRMSAENATRVSGAQGR
jgi:serine/threonine-protein kinase